MSEKTYNALYLLCINYNALFEIHNRQGGFGDAVKESANKLSDFFSSDFLSDSDPQQPHETVTD